MSQENLQTIIMQNFFLGGGVKEVYYGIVQVVNWLYFSTQAIVKFWDEVRGDVL